MRSPPPSSPCCPRLLSLRAAALLLLLGALPVQAAEPAQPAGHYAFRSYGSEQGLRHLAVFHLAQDAQGFLWAGTEQGLYRFDGQRFQHYGEAQGLPSLELTRLESGRVGPLWVGTRAGLAVLEGTRFRVLGAAQGLPASLVKDLAVRADGAVYVAQSEGLFEGASPDGPFHRVAGYPLSGAARVWVSPDGRALYVAQGRMFAWRDESTAGAWRTRELPDTQLVYSIVRDAGRRLWLRGPEALWMLRTPDGPLEDRSAALPGPPVSGVSLHLDAAGVVWVPTSMGVVRFENERPHLLSEAQGLPKHWAEAVLVDGEGSLWVASEGVHRLQGRHVLSAHTRRSGLPADTVWSIFRDREQRLWVGTQAGLVQGDAGGWTAARPVANRPVYALAQDASGTLWAGGAPANLAASSLRYLGVGQREWRDVQLGLPRGNSSISTLLTAAPADGAPDAVLYVGTLRHGLLRLSPGAQPAQPRVEHLALPEAQKGEQVNSLLRDRQGRLWVAGRYGLARLQGGRWQRYGTRDGLLEAHVSMMTEMPSGELLLSYWNRPGLTRFDPDTGRAQPLKAPAELTSDTLYSLAYDPAGRLWTGTTSGIKRWDPKGGQLQHFTRGDGVPGEDCSGGALTVEPNGDVWVGMSSGLVHYDASRDPGAPPPPRTVLTGLAFDQQPPAPLAPAPALQQVPKGARTVELHYAVPSYVSPTALQTQVRLVGFEDAWREGEPGGRARYTALPPGSYRFEARARLGTGTWGAPASLAFHVPTPTWRHPLAFALYGFALAGLIALGVRWKTARLRKENERLEALVRERTRELEETTLLDPLTGAKNRRFLRLTLPEDASRVLRRWSTSDRSTRELGPPNADLLFFMVDLDYFKEVNDTYGHGVGDRVLQQASDVLRSVLRETDTLVRWGGEEFLVVAQQTDRRAAEAIALKLRDAIRDHVFDLGNGQTLRRTTSIGFAAFPFLPGAPEAVPWEEVLELADRCLYAAKRAGRDGWVGVMSLSEEDLPNVRERVGRDLDSLVESGAVELRSSFGAERKVAFR